MALSGIVVGVPEADAVVGRWRRLHDPSAREGMPAHVTLLYPFLDATERDGAVMERLAGMFAATPVFELKVSKLGRFPNTLWLAPEPVEPIRRLTEILAAAFPSYPPYGGAFEEIAPHLTVARGEQRILDRVGTAVAAGMFGPIRSRITAADLYDRDNRRWRRVARFPLGPVAG